jgi:hypothetical protein
LKLWRSPQSPGTDVAAVTKIGQEEWMIEDIGYAHPESDGDAFVNSEVLMHAQIDVHKDGPKCGTQKCTVRRRSTHISHNSNHKVNKN